MDACGCGVIQDKLTVITSTKGEWAGSVQAIKVSDGGDSPLLFRADTYTMYCELGLRLSNVIELTTVSFIWYVVSLTLRW